MSQQTNAGFNAPRFSVVADDPGGVVPKTAIAARSGPCDHMASCIAPIEERTPLSDNDAVAVGQFASATLRIATSPAELPASFWPLRAGERLVGVANRDVASASIIGSVLPFVLAAHFA